MWSGEGQKTNSFTAKASGEGVSKTNAAVFAGHRRSHGDGAEKVAQAANADYKEETKANTEEGIEDRLDADSIDNISEESDSEQEREGLQPNE